MIVRLEPSQDITQQSWFTACLSGAGQAKVQQTAHLLHLQSRKCFTRLGLQGSLACLWSKSIFSALPIGPAWGTDAQVLGDGSVEPEPCWSTDRLLPGASTHNSALG